jgi:putative ABC transport system permease protein
MLATAFAALVLLSRLLVYEYSFDQAINPEGDVYRVGTMITRPGRAPDYVDGGYGSTAGAIRARAPGWTAARVTRGITPQEIRAGDTVIHAPVSSAETEFARVLRIDVLSGDLEAALARPDGVALTRAMADRLFGTAGAVGRSLEVAGQAATVGAVIADWPRNSSFRDFQLILSAANPASDIRTADAPREFAVGSQRVLVDVFGTVSTYAKAPGDPATIRGRLDEIANADIASHSGSVGFGGVSGARIEAHAVPLSRANLVAEGARAAGEQGADPAALAALTGLGGALLLIAGLNFVSVSATRAAARAKDIAIRKTFGATRLQLGLASLGGSVAVACAAAVLGILIALALRGWFANLVGREISLLPTPALASAMLAAGILTGAAAGLLPMLTLTAPRPSVILQTRARRAGRLRAILLAVQVAAASVAVTFGFALAAQYEHLVGEETLHIHPKGIAWATVAPAMEGGMSEDRLRALVDRAASSEAIAAAAVGPVPARGGLSSPVQLTAGAEPLDADSYMVSPGWFDLLGVRPLAGRLFTASDRGSLLRPEGVVPIIIDRTTSTRLGFAGPSLAVGAVIRVSAGQRGAARVVGVVPDIDLSADRSSRRDSIVYAPGYRQTETLLVRVEDGGSATAALTPIARSVSPAAERSVATLSSVIAAKYADIGRLLGAIGALAALGLVSTIVGAAGLAASLSAEMAHEAAVRKSFGAEARHVLLLFAARVAWPILAGVAIGVPGALWLAGSWLEHYPDRVSLGILPGLASALLFVCLIAGVLLWRGLSLARLRPALILRQL